MGERVGADESYCGIAEDIMEYAAHQNMAAGARNTLLSPKRRRVLYPKVQPDEDDPRIKVCRDAAQAADELLRTCARCVLGAVRPDTAGGQCQQQQDFYELQRGTKAQLDNMRDQSAQLNVGQEQPGFS